MSVGKTNKPYAISSSATVQDLLPLTFFKNNSMSNKFVRPGFSAVRDDLQIVFKIKYNDETRKMSYASLPSFPILKDNVEKLFEIYKPFTLKYVDPEGDLITVTTNNELEEAVSLAPVQDDASVIKLKVVLGSSSPSSSPKRSEETNVVASTFHDFLKSVITPENIERFRSWLTPENVERARDHLKTRLDSMQQRAERNEPYTFEELVNEATTFSNGVGAGMDDNSNQKKEQAEEDAAMSQLADMGFDNEELNRSIYRQNGRDLQSTLNILVNM